MQRVQFIQYKGKSILVEDFSNLNPGKEMFDTIAAAQAAITGQPPKSVLAVLDASGAHFDAETLSKMKNFVKANGPHIRCSVVVGVKGLLHIALHALSSASGRSFRTFNDRQSAFDYLAVQ